MKKALAALAMAGVIAGCAPQLPRPTEQPAEEAPAGFPVQRYQAALARGEPIYRIDRATSLVVIEVRRAGSLARLGHDHVVASHDVQGYVAPTEARADFYVPLGLLVVDETALRAEAGFDTQPSEEDIAGTRRNMMTRVLAVEAYPYAVVAVSDVAPRAGNAVADVAIALHGTTRKTQIPLRIETGSEEVTVTASVVLAQSDFGITPLSILGGAIQVADEVRLRLQIRARRCLTPTCRRRTPRQTSHVPTRIRTRRRPPTRRVAASPGDSEALP